MFILYWYIYIIWCIGIGDIKGVFLMVEFNFCNIFFKDFSESLYIEDNEYKLDVSFDIVVGYDNVCMD